MRTLDGALLNCALHLAVHLVLDETSIQQPDPHAIGHCHLPVGLVDAINRALWSGRAEYIVNPLIEATGVY